MHLSKKYTTMLIFLIIFLTKIPFITNSPYETGESWRQSDTESMARNFVEEHFHILYPQLNYDGAPPNYAQLEFQITTFLIALLYKLFGFHYVLARLVPILFFLGSAYFLYLIAKKFYSTEMAWLTIIVYAAFPLNLYFSRAIMPESAVLFFTLGGLYFFLRWIDTEKNNALFLATFMTAMAILVKIPAIFIGIPMLVTSIMKYKWKIFTVWQLWLFAICSLSIPFIYFKWLEGVAEFTFVTGIGSKHIIPKFAQAIFSHESLQFFYTHLPQSFTWIGLLLILVGMLKINWKKEYPIGVWLIAFLLELVTIVAVIKFNYYLVFIGPIFALLAGRTLAGLLKWRAGSVSVIVVLTIVLVNSYLIVQPKFMEKDTLLRQAEYVKKYTDKDDLIVVGTFSPELINASERKGWRANIDYYEYIPKGPKAEMDYFIAHGAKYFVPNKGYIYGDVDQQYRKYLEANFTKVEVTEDSEYSFYKLN